MTTVLLHHTSFLNGPGNCTNSGAISGTEPSGRWASAIVLANDRPYADMSYRLASRPNISEDCSSQPTFSRFGQSVGTD